MTDITSPRRDGRKVTGNDPAAFRSATYFIDCDDPLVRRFAADRTRGANTDREKAVRLFYAVRDEIRYDPYSLRLTPESFRASNTLRQGAGWCVLKGVLIAAACRAAGVPARVGYADVRNHLATPRLRELMGSDVFSYHGYVEIHLAGRWVKATPVFDRALCDRFNVLPQEFDGVRDSLFQQYDAMGRRHMEYVKDHGPYDDLPLQEILEDFRRRYPKLVEEQRNSRIVGDFAAEASQAAR